MRQNSWCCPPLDMNINTDLLLPRLLLIKIFGIYEGKFVLLAGRGFV